MRIATLAFIIRGDHILLGVKRGGPEIGEGVLSAPGGKFDPPAGDITLLDCVVREVEEEFGVTLGREGIEKIAIITFFAAGTPDFKVHIYKTSEFTGEPRATESMHEPEWYPLSNLPFERMYDSDAKWLPFLLEGNSFCANVYYRERAKGFDRIEFLPFVDSDSTLN